jgi:hypothetical protein
MLPCVWDRHLVLAFMNGQTIIAIEFNCQAEFCFQMAFIFYDSIGIHLEARLILNQMVCQIIQILQLRLKSSC